MCKGYFKNQDSSFHTWLYERQYIFIILVISWRKSFRLGIDAERYVREWQEQKKKIIFNVHRRRKKMWNKTHNDRTKPLQKWWMDLATSYSAIDSYKTMRKKSKKETAISKTIITIRMNITFIFSCTTSNLDRDTLLSFLCYQNVLLMLFQS